MRILGSFIGGLKANATIKAVPAVEGTGLAMVIPARGAAFGDLFNDGKVDVVINCIDYTPVLLRNVNADRNHWVGIQLIGGARGPKPPRCSSAEPDWAPYAERNSSLSAGPRTDLA